jgi:hypothetical protein
MKQLRLFGIGAVALALGACTVNEGPRPGMRVDDARAPHATVQYDRVVILDQSLQSARGGKLAIESQGARRTATGTLEVYAVIRNRTDYPLQVEGRVQFFDPDKVPVEGPSAWQRVYLSPNSVQTFRETSTRVHDIAHYYVEIREGR